jgi:hypothetical protein
MTATGAQPGLESREGPGFSPTGEVLRDIARGGIAGAIAGLVVGGVGGRLLMRLVAILHADAVGSITENGNRVGDITLTGTIFLLLFGLIFGVLAGAVWVIVGPFVPGGPRTRALLTAGIAIAVGTPELIIGTNPDFVLVEHDARVVALLVALVGSIGLAIALVDGWLDRRLPHAVAGRRGPAAAYAIVALLGAGLVVPFALLVFLTADEYQLPLREGYALVVVGLCLATWWILRIRGRATAPRGLVVVARGALLLAVILGVLTTLPHLFRALGAPS